MNGATPAKLAALLDTCQDEGHVPDVLLLGETHRIVDGGAVEGYSTYPGMQNVDLYPGHVLAGGPGNCGGVAVLLRSPGYRELHSERHKYWVASAIKCVETADTWVVAAIYVPPAASQFYDQQDSGLGGYLDALLEDVRMLQMRYHVPNTHVLLGGDLNAHVSAHHAKGGGPLPCGEVQDDVLSLSFEGSHGNAPVYSLMRCSESTIRIEHVHTPRGDAVNRMCRNHGLLVLNGRAQSDRHGAYTSRVLQAE